MEEGGRYGIIAGKNRFSGRKGRAEKLGSISGDHIRRYGRREEGKKRGGRWGKKEGTYSLAENMEEKGDWSRYTVCKFGHRASAQYGSKNFKWNASHLPTKYIFSCARRLCLTAGKLSFVYMVLMSLTKKGKEKKCQDCFLGPRI